MQLLAECDLEDSQRRKKRKNYLSGIVFHSKVMDGNSWFHVERIALFTRAREGEREGFFSAALE